MQTVSRTLVKSPPEIWEMVDRHERMQGLMSALLGRPAGIRVLERLPGERLAWEADGEPEPGRIEVDIRGSGWGTEIALSAECARGVSLDGWLDAVLDELATPEKRPLDGIV